MGAYGTVTPAVIDELRSIVGERFVWIDDESLEAYSHDEIPDPAYAHAPEVVVAPRTAAEISAIMILANRERIPVTPRGAGSGLSGGAVPIHGGILLRADRQDEIIEVDLENMMVVVEPGVITAAINERLAGTGLFYAGYPMSLGASSIGGNVAENAGGGKAVKYGVTARYVLGVEVVTPTGAIVQYGGKLIKDVTGYNMAQLMVGSEGTLGIFTRIFLRLIPAPTSSVDLLVLFPTVEAAVAAVPAVMATGGITPTAMEFIDGASWTQACRFLNETLPHDAAATMIITVDGTDREQVERDYLRVGEQCEAAGAIEVYVADDRPTSTRIWDVRRNIAESYAALSPHQANEDLVVPPAAIAPLIAGMGDIGRRYDIAIPAYGHAGDGNIHTRLVKNPAWTIDEWRTTLPKALDDLYALTASLGGRISGEHGIGHKRKPYMDRFVSAEYLETIRSIKRALDPNNVLNPGKIVDV